MGKANIKNIPIEILHYAFYVYRHDICETCVDRDFEAIMKYALIDFPLTV